MHRMAGENGTQYIQEVFPLYYLENVGSYSYGLVTGKRQHWEPWESVWQAWEEGSNRDVDFRLWFHDLFRPSGRPYDPNEIELIKKFAAFADRDFERTHQL